MQASHLWDRKAPFSPNEQVANPVEQDAQRWASLSTAAEPMWKGRPVIATAVGGIQNQRVDGVSGVLLRRGA